MKQKISWIEGTSLLIGAVLGSGILVLPITIAQMIGVYSIYSWAIMLILCIPTILVISKLAIEYPEAGGFAAYANQVFGNSVGKLVSYLFLLTVPLSAPVASIIAGKYVSNIFKLSTLEEAILVLSLLILSVLLNVLGLKISGRIQSLLIIGLVIVLGMTIYSGLHDTSTIINNSTPVDYYKIGSTLGIIFWAFVGWEVIINITDEFKNPKKDIPISLLMAYIVIAIIYLLLVMSIITNSVYLKNINMLSLPIIIENTFGTWGKLFSSLFGVIACYGTMHIYVAAFSRLVQAQAAHGDFPKYFAMVNSRYNTPTRVLYVTLLFFCLTTFVYYYFNINFDTMLKIPSIIFVLVYIIGMASAVCMFKNYFYKILSIISLFLFILVYAFSGLIGFIVVLVCIGLYCFIKLKVRQ